jgi:hypothetical protein
MADPQIYENAAIFVQGVLLIESTSISVNYEDGDKPLTLIGGRFGIDAGTRIMRVQVSQAIPVGFPDFDIAQTWLDGSEVNFAVQLLGSGQRMNAQGYITSPRYEFGVGKSAALSFGFIGKAALFQ